MLCSPTMIRYSDGSFAFALEYNACCRRNQSVNQHVESDGRGWTKLVPCSFATRRVSATWKAPKRILYDRGQWWIIGQCTGASFHSMQSNWCSAKLSTSFFSELSPRDNSSVLRGREFQFGQKKFRFDSIRFDSRYRIDFFDSIRFGNLINLPLVHWYSNSKLGVIFIVCIA